MTIVGIMANNIRKNMFKLKIMGFIKHIDPKRDVYRESEGTEEI